MVTLLSRLPGGLFPRLVALFPLLFPLYLIQGVLLGVPVNLPEVFLTAIGLYFLFEHDSFRWGAWKLWPVFLYVVGAVSFVLFAPLHPFIPLKSWILFPLIFFVVSRNVFREKASMIFLSAKSLLVLSGVLSIFLLNPGIESLGTATALSLFVGPGLVLAGLSSIYSTTKISFGVYAFLFFYFSFSLFSSGAFGVLGVAFWVLFVHGIFKLKSVNNILFLVAGFLSIALTVALVFLLVRSGSFTFELPTLLLNSWPAPFFGAVIGLSALWLSARAFLWLLESDGARRHFIAWAYLCFIVSLCLNFSSLALSHLFFFWFFMAILL